MTFPPVFRIWVGSVLKIERHFRTSAFLGFIKSVRLWKWLTPSREGYLTSGWKESLEFESEA